VPCAKLTPGHRVPVYYLRGNPEEHAATRNPQALAWQELLIVTAFRVVTFALIALLFWVQARRAQQ